MLGALSMYGPHSQARADCGDVAIGRCLMQLLPEDARDRQPLRRLEAQTWLVADVRLDNREELAQRLGMHPNFANHCADSEILLTAWLRWGTACMAYLAGAFCFAVWDASRQQLFLARDHVGYRPLFFHRSAHCFAFASMPKGLLSLPGIATVLDEQQLALQLALVPTAPGRTMFTGIDRLPPGHYACISRCGTEIKRYWHPDDAPDIRLASDDDYVDAFRERFDTVVRAQLRSTAGVASHLSGGLDSSAVSATAARLLAAEGRELLALTSVPRAGFASGILGRFGDEGPAAAELAAMHPNIRHLLVNTRSQRFLEVIDHNSRLDDRPVFNPTNGMWLNAIRDEVHARGIHVLLVGQFGNATISYNGLMALSEWFRSGQWCTLARVGRAMTRTGYASTRTVLGHAIRPSLPRSLQRLRTRRSVLDFSLVHPDVAHAMGLAELAEAGFTPDGKDGLSVARTLFRRGELGDVRAGTRAGWLIDERDPTRDRRIVEFCFGIPPEQFLSGGRTRSLVRRAMRGYVPEATLAQRDTGIQSADWHLSVAAERHGMASELERIGTSPVARRCLDLPRMRDLIEHWPTSGFADRAVFAQWHHALTRGLSVGHFIRRFDSTHHEDSFP